MDPDNMFNPFAAALGWVVLHSLWQITLIYLLFRVAARIWRKHPRAIYHAALLGMTASVVWAVLTFSTAWENYQWSREWNVVPAEENVPAVPAPEVAPLLQVVQVADVPIPWRRQFIRAYESWAAPVGWFWSLCALLLVLRLLGGYWLSRRIRRSGVAPVPEQWRQQLQQWSVVLEIKRPVRWLESTRVSQPLTLGFWKPVVLFPAGLLFQLQPGQVEALLLHELAHIRRHDYLINLVQLALEVCFFYHPLFWLLSKEARRQREYCCDDLVLRYCPDRLLYAQTLTNLQYTHLTLNQFAMHAIGKSAFAQRIFRLFNLEPENAQRSPGIFILGIVLLSAAALGWSSFTQKPQPAPSELALVFPDRTPAETAQAPVVTQHKPAATALVIAPDTVSPSVIAVEATNMNVFYIGVDNPVTVAAPGYDCAELTVRLLGPGTLTALGDCRYNVVATAPGELGIAVFSKKNNLEKELGVKMYRVKRIPADPALRFEQNKNAPKAKVAAVAAPSPSLAEYARPPVEFEPLPATIPSPTVAVAANKMNVFYVGVNNPITVVVPGYKCGELELRLSGGTASGSLIPLGDCRYFVRVSKPGTINVGVFTRKHKKEVQLGVQTFRAKWIPDPVPYLADYSQSNTVSQAEIRNMLSRKLEAVIENFDYDNAHCAISQYTLAIREANADVIEYVIRDNKIPGVVLDKMEELPVGSVIYILEPHAKCPGDSAPRVLLGDLVFKVVP
ncbi:MAG: GldM family protein [Saprospiraceae bacterium]